MIISKECIEAINYITKIYPCFKSPDDVIRGMLRDFARNTDNDVIIDILKTKNIVTDLSESLEEDHDQRL